MRTRTAGVCWYRAGVSNLRRAAAIAALALASGIVGACVSGAASPPPSPLRPCSTPGGLAAECGTITVAENRATGQGRTIDIAFQVLRAEPGPARDAVFLFAGGPGQAATSMASIAAGWMRPLRASLDIVLVDQRGTGESHPLMCDNDAARAPALAFGHVLDPEWVRRCRAALEPRADLTQYGTRRAIDDIDDVRSRLGYERISIYGASYGTRLALAYAQRFPDRVRSMVLDGVLPPDVRGVLSYAASADAALDRLIAACRHRPECDRAHPRLAGDVDRVFTRFDAGPLRTTIQPAGGAPIAVEMTRGDFGYAVRGMMYDARAVLELPGTIARAAATGDVSAFAQAYWERAARLHRTLAHGNHLSVLCGEDVALIRDEDVDAATTGTFLGRYLADEYRRACAAWPQAPAEALASPGPTFRAPTLLVSGQFDPVTPPELAARLAASLPLMRHIIAPTGSHGSVVGCPRAAALHVLIRANFEGLPGGCEP
jgi:pimeloyl-ACP methyl ester carboxylesterase